MLHITYIEDKFLQNIDLIVFFQQKAIVKVVKVVFQSIKNCESMSYDMSKKFHIFLLFSNYLNIKIYSKQITIISFLNVI